MKNLIILLVSICIFSSCSTDDEITDSKFLGEWKLVRTTGQFEGSERTGAEMEWQESYVLRPNGAFTKTRVRNDETTIAEGTFILNNEPYPHGQSGIAHITMNFESHDIIATCYSDLKEELIFRTDELMISTWHQCDGLKLEYVKKDKK